MINYRYLVHFHPDYLLHTFLCVFFLVLGFAVWGSVSGIFWLEKVRETRCEVHLFFDWIVRLGGRAQARWLGAGSHPQTASPGEPLRPAHPLAPPRMRLIDPITKWPQ